MLSFFTEFPLAKESTSEGFISCFKKWVLDSPHTPFVEDDFSGFGQDGNWNYAKGGHRIDSVCCKLDDEASVGLKLTSYEQDISWSTEVVFSKVAVDIWVSIRTSRESQHLASDLPEAKKPIIVNNLLAALGGGQDGRITVSNKALRLKNSEIPTAAQLILSEAECRLPVVYVSAKFGDGYFVDPDFLARDLAGLAHVVVEPNRPFSTRLKIDVHSYNAYGGAIGIYWPDDAGRRLIFPTETSNQRIISKEIMQEIRYALLHRRPLYKCTWSYVQELYSRRAIEILKESQSGSVDEYIKHFDAELSAQREKGAALEREVERLGLELRKKQIARDSIGGLQLYVGSEQDYFEGEIASVIIDAVESAARNSQSDSRRQHILECVYKNNPPSRIGEQKRDEIKKILRDYKEMSKSTKDALISLGFAISDGGKHYKLVYNNDDRYTFVLPKTGGDRRGGLNAASDISKRLF